MSNPILAHMHAQCWFLSVFISSLWIKELAGMDLATMPKKCGDHVCENNNVCRASLVDGTPVGNAYCLCRGEWAGFRCEARLHASVNSISTERVTIGLVGKANSSHHVTWTALHVKEMTVAYWNVNISDQCMLYVKRNPQNSVTLDGLAKSQAYIVCLANGRIDSCAYFRKTITNISSVTHCLSFETKAVDESPFDIGIVIVPCAVMIFLVIISVFVYCNRHSFILRLFLHILCCRNCYKCRKRVERIKLLRLRKQREISHEGLMSLDLPGDYEGESEMQLGSLAESGYRITQSSNVSTSGSGKSACSVEPEDSFPAASIDQNAYLYENQSLIAPIYSPPDHKILTLTYLDNEFYPGQHVSSYGDPLCPLGLPYTLSSPTYRDSLFPTGLPPSMASTPLCEDSMYAARLQNPLSFSSTYVNFPFPAGHHQSLSRAQACGDNGVRQPTHTRIPPKPEGRRSNSIFKTEHPWIKMSSKPPSSFSKLDTAAPRGSTGLVKKRTFSPKYNHYVCELSQPNSTLPSLPHSQASGIHSSMTNNDVKFRYLNHSTKPRPRPYSLPYTLMRSESSRNLLRNLTSAGDYSNIHHASLNPPSTATSSFTSFSPGRFQKSPLAKSHWRDLALRQNQNRANYFLGSPRQYKSILTPKTHFDCNGDYDTYLFNTLPRLKKSRFLVPQSVDEDSEEVSPSTLPRVSKSALISKPPQRPTKLDIPVPGFGYSRWKDLNSKAQVPAISSTMPNEVKFNGKQVKKLYSQIEQNLSFLRPSKSRETTDEEKEFYDLQSPLAEERSKSARKPHRSKKKGKSLRQSKPAHDNTRLSFLAGPVFYGHPSEHTIPPFSTDDEDEELPTSDASYTSSFRSEDSTLTDEPSLSSVEMQTKESIISSYDHDDTNLVTPFCTEDSSDDDTCHDIQSLTGSMETLQDMPCDNHYVTNDSSDDDAATFTSEKSKDFVGLSRESENLLSNISDS